MRCSFGMNCKVDDLTIICLENNSQPPFSDCDLFKDMLFCPPRLEGWGCGLVVHWLPPVAIIVKVGCPGFSSHLGLDVLSLHVASVFRAIYHQLRAQCKTPYVRYPLSNIRRHRHCSCSMEAQDPICYQALITLGSEKSSQAVIMQKNQVNLNFP